MPSKLVSTGVQFPDGSTQTTAAVAGVSVSSTTTTVYQNYPNHPYQQQDSISNITLNQKATVPRVECYTAGYSTPYQGRLPRINATSTSGVILNYAGNNMDSVPYPPANYSPVVKCRATGSGGEYYIKSDAAWRVSYHYLT